MHKLSLPLLFGMAFSFALTPISRRLAIRIGAIDKPGERHIHTVATPRLGGPAIFIALISAIVLAAALDSSIRMMLGSDWHRLLSLAIGASMVMLIGALDDVRPLQPVTKLLVEIAAASVAVYGGYRIDALPGFGLVSSPLSVFFIVAAANAVNLVDGLDGLAVGLSLIISAMLLLLCLSVGALEPCVMLAALGGALIGFLPHNFHPARIFLGDSGALLLGFMVGAGAITTSHHMVGPIAMLAPVLALGLPFAELMLTIMRRILRPARVRQREGEAGYQFVWMSRPTVFSGDSDHIHHRLLGRGLSHSSVVLLLYAVCATLGAAAFALATRPEVVQVPLLAALVVAFVAGVRWLGYRELMPLRTGLLLPLFESRALNRKAFQVMVDAIAIASSYTLAALLERDSPRAPRDFFFITLALIAAAQMAAFAMSGLYRRAWRNPGIDEVIAATKALAFAVAASTILATLILSAGVGARTVILDAYLLATMVFGARFSFRVLEHLFQDEHVDSERRPALGLVRFDIDPQAAGSGSAAEPTAPRRSAAVIPIRGAGVPQ